MLLNQYHQFACLRMCEKCSFLILQASSICLHINLCTPSPKVIVIFYITMNLSFCFRQFDHAHLLPWHLFSETFTSFSIVVDVVLFAAIGTNANTSLLLLPRRNTTRRMRSFPTACNHSANKNEQQYVCVMGT